MRYDKFKNQSTKKKEDKLFQLFENLNSDMRETESKSLLELFQIYSGNDAGHRKELEKFFNSEEAIYDSLEFNSNIKSLISKYIQPFFSKDNLITFAPLNDKIEVIERVSKLINDQIKSEDFIEEMVKCVKDSCIYGKAFMSLGWSVEKITIPKKTRTVERDPATGKVIMERETNDVEEIVIEKPEFRAERVSDVLYPKVSKWEDVSYVIKIERVSPYIYNQRYNKKEDEINLDRSTFDDYETPLDNTLEKVPGSDISYSDAYENEILLLHYYFADGSYYVARLDKQTSAQGKEYIYGVKLVYEGSTPIPGVPIPIYFLNLEPITGRLAGESLINVGKNEHRKLMEADNHHLRMLRKLAGDNIIVSDMAVGNIKKILDRKPGEPIMVEGNIRDGIIPFPNQGLTPEFIQTRQIYKSTLDSTLGVNDFFNGAIGRSARLTGVDSLLSNALSRLTVGMNQISKFILKVADGLVLANRAFLPRTYIQIDTSLHVSEPLESYEIPYPLQAKISSPVDGGSDLSVKLGSFYQFLQLAMSMEQVKPGSFDIMGLLQYGFSMAGLPEVKRFILKMPLTAGEATNLEMLDKMARLLQQSSLPNNENPFGSPIAPMDAGGVRASQNQEKLNTDGQNMSQSDIGEIGNF